MYLEVDAVVPEKTAVKRPAFQPLMDIKCQDFTLMDEDTETVFRVRGHRLRTKRIRGVYSQGFLLPMRELTITDTRELYRELEKGERHGPLKRRIDALMFSPDGMRTAIEIKVDVADAQRESWAKIRPWMMVVHRYVYAVPAGLIDRPPVGADQRSGLVWVYPDGRVEWKKKCKINHSPEALPQLTMFNMAWRAAKGEARSF